MKTMQKKIGNMIIGTGLASIVAASMTAVDGQTIEEDGPLYQNETTLIRPDNYREW